MNSKSLTDSDTAEPLTAVPPQETFPRLVDRVRERCSDRFSKQGKSRISKMGVEKPKIVIKPPAIEARRSSLHRSPERVLLKS